MCLSNNSVKDGFGIILTLRHLNNNRFYANQSGEKEKKVKGLRKKRVFLSFVVFFFFASAAKRENLLKGIFFFAKMTVCIYKFFIRLEYF